MKFRKWYFLVLPLFTVFVFSFSLKKTNQLTEKPERIIFIIGDGMGLAQISGAMYDFKGQNAFERFKVIGFHKTSSADNYITDSGAGATAFSIGTKTNNGSIGIDANDSSRESIFEKLKTKNWGTGVVVTSSVTHATPAAFYAHVKSRNSEEEIAEFLLKKNCDIAIGGGLNFFTKRSDNRNLLNELQTKGFRIYSDTNNLVEANDRNFICLLAAKGMRKKQDGRGDYLKKATAIASNALNKNFGNYFLMVEGSQIDWGGHENNFEYMKAELLDLNDAINYALDEAIKDKKTLVVVTADHETGGLSLLQKKSDKFSLKPEYSTLFHSGIMVPVFAFGPGAEDFGGIYENNEIFTKFLKLLELK